MKVNWKVPEKKLKYKKRVKIMSKNNKYEINKYRSIHQERLKEINKLLKADANNYSLLTEEEKENAQIVLSLLKNENFNPNLFTDNILYDFAWMKNIMIANYHHIGAFKVKVDDEDEAKALISVRGLDFKPEYLDCFSDEIKKNKNVMYYFMHCKPYLFQYLPKEIREDKEINAIYVNSNFVQWKYIEELYKTKEIALRVISKNLNNLPDIVQDFPKMKNKVKTLEEIGQYFKNEVKVKSKLVNYFNETFTLNAEEFLNLLDKSKDIHISKSFIQFLSLSKFSDNLSLITDSDILEKLSNKDNHVKLLKMYMRQSLLLNKITDKNFDVKRTKAKI